MESRILLDGSQYNSGEFPITPINSFYSFLLSHFQGEVEGNPHRVTILDLGVIIFFSK